MHGRGIGYIAVADEFLVSTEGDDSGGAAGPFCPELRAFLLHFAIEAGRLLLALLKVVTLAFKGLVPLVGFVAVRSSFVFFDHLVVIDISFHGKCSWKVPKIKIIFYQGFYKQTG
jgi:hypothetical protein